MNNQSEFDKMAHAQAMTLLFGAYGQTSDKNRMLIYAKALQIIPKDLLMSVVKKAIYQNKYMPSIAELLEACRSLKATTIGKSEVPNWNEAWAEIEKAMYATPFGKVPRFSHPAIEQAVNNYGWQSIHKVMADDFHTMQAQLRRMYDECSRQFIENKRNQEILGENPLLENTNKQLTLESKIKDIATRTKMGVR